MDPPHCAQEDDAGPAIIRPAPIDVVVPAYNHERFIERCLRSVFRQTCPPARLLVIDDGSTDGTARIASATLETSPFPVELIVRPNRGLSATLNEALANTASPLFTYLGSDDVWQPARIERSVQRLDETPDAVLAFGACEIIDADDRVVGVWGTNYHALGLDLEQLLQFRSIPISSTVTYRRAAVERFGWNEASVQEDYELYLRLAATGRFVYIDEVLACWRFHPGNTTKDLGAMLEAALSAQSRLGQDMDIAPAELARYARNVRFAYGGDFLWTGDWRTAARLTMANLGGARTRRELALRLVRMAIPQPILRARRRALVTHRPRTTAVAGSRETAD